jgi:hypothetical protein
MSVMCTMAACKAMQGMCTHEKVMLIVGLLVLGGGAVYLLL